MIHFHDLFTWASLISLVSLCLMEIVLGVDNIIFISILTDRLPAHEQEKARRLGLSLALIIRVALLFSIGFIMTLTKPLFVVAGHDISVRALILMGGGLFLLAKSTSEIHEKVERGHEHETSTGSAKTFWNVALQIIMLDVVFSIDSIITAVGMVDNVLIMIIAVVVSMGVMLIFAADISKFINRNPAIKILALSFLMMIGLLLVMEGLEIHVDKGYIYFAMAFAFVIELINKRMRKNAAKHVAEE